LPAGKIEDGIDLKHLVIPIQSGGENRLVVGKAVRLADYRGKSR
jgi:hypothetical protein